MNVKMEPPIYMECLYHAVIFCKNIVQYVNGQCSKEVVMKSLKTDEDATKRANVGERFGFKVLPITAILHGIVGAYLSRETPVVMVAVLVSAALNVGSLFYKHGLKIESRPAVLMGYVTNVLGFILACSIFGFGPWALVNKVFWMGANRLVDSVCDESSNLLGIARSEGNVLDYMCTSYHAPTHSRSLIYVLMALALLRRVGYVLDMLINHEIFRETIARRLNFKLSFTDHAVDAVYALTYGLLAQFSSMLLLEAVSLYLAPENISVLHIVLVMLFRGTFINVAYNFVGAAYFIFHRLGHCKTIYYLFHREHHLPFNQGALSGALGSGLNEGLLELLNTTLPYIMIPCYDYVTVSLYSSFNEFAHIYYNKREWLRVAGMKYVGKVYSVWRCPLTPLTQHFAIAPFFDGFFRFEYEDAKVESEDVFHGAHHWKNAPNFGYGFFDSFANNIDRLDVVVEAYRMGKYRSMGKGFGGTKKTGGFDSKKHFS